MVADTRMEAMTKEEVASEIEMTTGDEMIGGEIEIAGKEMVERGTIEANTPIVGANIGMAGAGMDTLLKEESIVERFGHSNHCFTLSCTPLFLGYLKMPWSFEHLYSAHVVKCHLCS